VVLPFLGPYLVVRGVGPVGVGLITAAFSLSKVVYTPLLGALVDRGHWFRGVLACHLGLSIMAAVALQWARASEVIGLAIFVVGIGFGTVLPLVEAAVLDRLPRVGYGALRLWGSVGFVVVGVCAAWRLDSRMPAFPWVLGVALAVLAVTCLPFEHVARPQGKGRSVRLPSVAWGLLVLLTLQQVAHGPYYAFFSIHLGESGLGGPAIAALWSLGVVSELAAFLAGRRLEAVFGLRRVLFVALLLSPLRWLLLALPVSLPVVVVAQLGHAVTFALVHLAGVQLVQRIAPPAARRFAQALYSGLTFGLGIVVGSAVAGPLYAAVGGSGAFLVAAGFSSLLVLLWLPLAGALRREGSARE